MAQNGRAKKPKNAANGTLNGSANGNGHMNGHADKTTSNPSSLRVRKPRRTMAGAFTSIAARVVTWYLLVTFIFRCPSSLSGFDVSSARVCKPYLHARSYVAPYLDPYYEAYAAPYVEKVKPYYTPVAQFTADKYATYGAHRVDQAQTYTNAQWDKSVRPQIESVQGKIQGKYDQYLGPHVKTVSTAAAPYYDQIKASVEEIYHLSVLPAYEASLPYLRKAHAQGNHVVVHLIFPYVRAGKDATLAFLMRTVWPQVRVLYGDNVEPQLVRISERLGRYRDQQKVESVVDAMESTSTVASESSKIVPTVAASGASSAAPSPSPSTKAGWGVFDDFFGGESSSASEVQTTSTATKSKQSKPPQPTGEELQASLNEDLRKWQSKFATAADKGAEDLEQRVAEITKRQIDSGVKGHGQALVVKLEETADATVASLKSFIKRTVESTPEDASEQDLEAAHAKCGAKTRELGLSVKDRAQAVRTWKTSYDMETDNLVKSAVRSTVEVLEKIHGLGLQEVGMRWAWLDGVTYKDWQNYHKLRNTLNEWQAEVEAVGARHDGLKDAHDAAKKLEDDAMDVSARMVNELIRLKEVAKWKLWASDSSDDFTNKVVPARVFKAAQSASSQVSEAIQGSSTPLSESVASSIESASSKASEAIQAIPSQASEAASVASSKASDVVLGSSTPLSESAASSVKSIASEASSVIVGSQTPLSESIASSAKSIASEASAAYESPKKVWGGANAQVLAEAKQVIFDEPLDGDEDENTFAKISSNAQHVVADAGDRLADLSSIISEAMLGNSATATSVAASRYAQAVTAASYAIYGTPTPTAVLQTVQIQASSRYSEAVSLASEQYEMVKSQVSVLASGTPQPAHESLLNYFGNAYSEALHYTDSVKSYAAGPTQGYFESVSSIAASRLSSGLSQASAQYAQPTGFSGQYYAAVGLAHERYSEFVGAASNAVYGPEQGTVESLASVASASAASIASGVSDSAQSVAANAQAAGQSVASQISSGVYGTETPWAESVASQASVNWDAIIAKASDQVYGKPTPWAESIYSQAGSYGAQATAAAAQQYADVQALISELVVGKEPVFTESILNRFSSAYHTGLPAAVSSVQSLAGDNLASVQSLAGDNLASVQSLAGDNLASATSLAAGAYASASSVVQSIFTPPPAIETILSQASAQLDAAVDSASIAVYGTPKGAAEQASSSVASAYSSIQSQVSEKLYGSQHVLDSFAAASVSAQQAISQAIYGAPTSTPAAAGAYSSMSSAASAAIYGPEQGAMESAGSRIAEAVEAANSRISAMYAQASLGAEDAASSASSVVAQATQRVRDEL